MMSFFRNLFCSSLGRKYLMAGSGAVLFLFVLGHMVGNLQIFLGPEAINRYGHFLQSNVEILWPVRLVLLALVLLHIWSATQLTLENRAARPVAYGQWQPTAASYASRTMMVSGIIVAVFIVYHLLHYTAMVKAVNLTGKDFDARPEFFDAQGRHDIYKMMVTGFQQLARLPLLSGGRFPALPAPEPRPQRHVPIAGLEIALLRAVPGAGRQMGGRFHFSGLQRHPRFHIAEVDTMKLDAKIPHGPLAQKWDQHQFDMKLVNPANKRKFDIIVVGTGLAGASAAASLAELGYNVKCFCFQDSPRRAHSIAAQGGINAAKNYQNDGDSVYRLFYDTIKGGDFRSREANVYRLAQVSVNIIDQCVAQGVPFAREYGGLLANRSFGGAQVSRTFYARGQTGQQLLLGAYQALCRQIALGGVKMYPRTEMLDLVVVNGHAKGIVMRDLVTGEISSHAADAVVLATGGYGNVFYLSTNAKGCNVTATWRAYKKGAFFANPCYTQIHPTCIPVSGEHQSKLTLMSESLRNDGRVWVPKRKGDKPPAAATFPRRTAITISNANTRATATWRRATSPRARPRKSATRAAASVRAGGASISTSPTPSSASARRSCASGTATCSTCTRRSPAKTPTRCRCAFIRPCITRWAACGWITT